MKESAVFWDGMLFYIALSRESSLTFSQRTERSERELCRYLGRHSRQRELQMQRSLGGGMPGMLINIKDSRRREGVVWDDIREAMEGQLI